LIALVIVASMLAASLAMTSLWQLVLLWGIGVGFGTGLTAMVLGATVATRWFSERRGLVMGMLSASTATGQLIFLPLLAKLTAVYGWRISLCFICAMIALAALAVLLLMRDRPADIGLPPFGAKEIVPTPPHIERFGALLLTPLRILKEVAATGAFWVLFGTFYICGLSTTGLIQTHFIALCGDYGLASVTAASALAMMGVFDFFGTIGSGWLSDRFDNRWLLFWYYGLRGLSLLYLPYTDFTFYGLSLFAMFYGLDWIATVPPTLKLTTRYFGAEKTNVVFGWIFAGHQLGAATAAYGAGLTRTEFATYLPAFFAAGAACIVAAFLVLALGAPKQADAGLEPKPA
jgi:sugar phosphate permease